MIIVADIIDGTNSKVVPWTLVIILDNFTGRKVANTRFIHIYRNANKRIVTGNRSLIQEVSQLGHIRSFALREFIGHFRCATIAFIRIHPEFTVPLVNARFGTFAFFEVFNQNGFAFRNTVIKCCSKSSLIRSFFGSRNKFRFPTHKEVIVFTIRFLLRSFTRIFRHFTFANFHLLQEGCAVHEGDFIGLLHLASHVVNLKQAFITGATGKEPVKTVNGTQDIFYRYFSAPPRPLKTSFQVNNLMSPFRRFIHLIWLVEIVISRLVKWAKQANLVRSTLVIVFELLAARNIIRIGFRINRNKSHYLRIIAQCSFIIIKTILHLENFTMTFIFTCDNFGFNRRFSTIAVIVLANPVSQFRDEVTIFKIVD